MQSINSNPCQSVPTVYTVQLNVSQKRYEILNLTVQIYNHVFEFNMLDVISFFGIALKSKNLITICINFIFFFTAAVKCASWHIAV